MRRPLLGLLLASTLLASTSLSARPALADPPPAPLAPSAAPPAYSPVPSAPLVAPLAGTGRRSSGAMVGGIVLASIGAVGMGFGTAIYADAADTCRSSFGGVRSSCSSSDGRLVGMTVLLTSAAGAAIGVPLWIYGAEKVVLPADQPPVREVSVRVGPTSATLHISF